MLTTALKNENDSPSQGGSRVLGTVARSRAPPEKCHPVEALQVEMVDKEGRAEADEIGRGACRGSSVSNAAERGGHVPLVATEILDA